jgi:hypothetical protein
LVIDAVAALVAVVGLAVGLPRCLRAVGLQRLPLPVLLFAVGAALAWCSTELNSHPGGNDVGDDYDDGAAWSSARWQALRTAPALRGLRAVHALRAVSPQLAYWVLLPPTVYAAAASLPWAALRQAPCARGGSSGGTCGLPRAALGLAGPGALACGGGVAAAVKWLLSSAGGWTCGQVSLPPPPPLFKRHSL